MVKDKKLTKIGVGSLVLDDAYVKVQGIKAGKLTNPVDLKNYGIEGVPNHWKRAMAIDTPTNCTETNEYFLDSAAQSDDLRKVLGRRATMFKIYLITGRARQARIESRRCSGASLIYSMLFVLIGRRAKEQIHHGNIRRPIFWNYSTILQRRMVHFPGLNTVVIGQIAPHITTKGDCESLFRQAGHLSHPNRSRIVAETFERYRRNKKLWNKDHDRDDVRFWMKQTEEYLKENPSHASFFFADEEDKGDGDDSDGDVVDVTDN
eukprot:scaffold7949_cov37-Cyclotella_meneghiniana.AAC.2